MIFLQLTDMYRFKLRTIQEWFSRTGILPILHGGRVGTRWAGWHIDISQVLVRNLTVREREWKWGYMNSESYREKIISQVHNSYKRYAIRIRT